MGVKRSQIQNLIIYIGDVFGITIGYRSVPKFV